MSFINAWLWKLISADPVDKQQQLAAIGSEIAWKLQHHNEIVYLSVNF